MVIDDVLSARRKSDFGVAYLYCNYNQKAQTVSNLLASIIQQLIATAAPTKNKALVQIVIDFRKDHKEGTPGLKKYHELFLKIASSFERHVVVIDALDECVEMDATGSGNRDDLISTIIESKAQLLVTSRPLPKIKELFSDAKELEIQPDPQDIKSYVQWRINNTSHGSRQLRKLAAKHKDLEAEIADVVVKKYSKMYSALSCAEPSFLGLTWKVLTWLDCKWIIFKLCLRLVMFDKLCLPSL